jgi:hypothetical protein
MVTEEYMRMMLTREINSKQSEREALEDEYGKVWDAKELQEDFKVIGFLAPFVRVVRKSDDKGGFLMFQHSPRFYFSFHEVEEEQ